jgi:hypothetical protein
LIVSINEEHVCPFIRNEIRCERFNISKEKSVMDQDNPKRQVRETASEARQGRRGTPVLWVLVIGLILAGIAWGAAEIFGEASDNSATMEKGGDQPQPAAPTNNAPAGTSQ